MTTTQIAASALRLRDVESGYTRTPVLHGVDLDVAEGRLTALLGANGAGKTTTLKTIAGLLPLRAGSIKVPGGRNRGNDWVARIRDGVVYLPQDNAVFGELTVRDNLLLGATLTKNRAVRDERYDLVLEMFPRLRERQEQRSSTMSGGEQRMLSVGIMLMAGARVLLLDEPSLGLAPKVVNDMMAALLRLVGERGLTVLLVEQDIGSAISYAHHVYVMRSGRVIWDGDQALAIARDDWLELF